MYSAIRQPIVLPTCGASSITNSSLLSYQRNMHQAVTKLCRVVSSSTPIARAKLKPSQLFEHGGIYGIDDALQNQSCPMN